MVRDTNKFILQIAPLVQKYAPQYNINTCSPIIAQAVLESASGTSDKVVKGNEWRHNYFGLKWRDKRCEISNDHFEEVTSEQRPNGEYYTKVDKFCKFKSMEDGVIGYFQWINTPNYANLKGIADPLIYLQTIKADKYATSINYVQNVMNVINKYNLTQFDTIQKSQYFRKQEESFKHMIFNIHAGHNPKGKVASGASSKYMDESTEARRVKDQIIGILRSKGHTVYDCTCNDGISQADVLRKIVAKCNEHTVDMDISIHFNSGASDLNGDKSTTGTEILLYSNTAKLKPVAERTVAQIAKLGFKNRGLKYRNDLYFLKNTKNPSMLIECCFLDDRDDMNIYNTENMAKAIVSGLLGNTVDFTTISNNSTESQSNLILPFSVICKEDMNIRSTPGGTIVKLKGCRKGVKYTIVEVSGNWGRLKSGLGWINIMDKYAIKENIG